MSLIKVFYLHDNKRNRHATIARYVKSVTNGTEEIIFSYSVSHPEDTFNKKLGRAIAIGRLTSDVGPEEAFSIMKPKDLKAIEAIRKSIVDNADIFPPCLVKMAK